jgi:hypothetical protein
MNVAAPAGGIDAEQSIGWPVATVRRLLPTGEVFLDSPGLLAEPVEPDVRGEFSQG